MTMFYDRVNLNLENTTTQHAVCKRLEQQWIIPIVVSEIMEELHTIMNGKTSG